VLKQQTDELRRMANVDGLTRIANRRSFDQNLTREWHASMRSGQPLSLALIDVDHFKKFNDRYGHIRGDECLRTVAGAIQSVGRRTTDLVARYGGEEFVIILSGTDRKAAEALGRRVVSSVAGLKIPHEDSPVAPVVTISLGMVTVTFEIFRGAKPVVGPLRAIPETAATSVADGALYIAKSAGRNQMVSVTHPVQELDAPAAAAR